jgi:hypothetical protein
MKIHLDKNEIEKAIAEYAIKKLELPGYEYQIKYYFYKNMFAYDLEIERIDNKNK